MTDNKTLQIDSDTKVSIMSEADCRNRILAIARGEYIPTPDEPKIYFESETAMKINMSSIGKFNNE